MAIKHYIQQTRSAKVSRTVAREADQEISWFQAHNGLLGFNAQDYYGLCIDTAPSLARLKLELAHRVRGLKVLPGQIAGEEDDIEIKVWYDNIYFTYNKLNKIYSVWCDWDTARGTSIAEVFQKWYDSDDSEISDPTDWIEF